MMPHSISPSLRIAIFVVSGLFAACSTSPDVSITQPAGESIPGSDSVGDVKKEPVYLSVAAVGDMMLGTDFPKNHLPDPGTPDLLLEMTPYLQSADIAFGNLEGTLMDGGEPVKQCSNPERCYLFRSPTAYAEQFSRAGFDVLSLANNHAVDFGEEGRSATMQALDAVGIYHSGRIGDVARWRVKGQRLAMIAFAPFKGSHGLIDLDEVRALVSSVSEENDIVIVSMHAGAEGLDAHHIPFTTEFYYGENRGDVVAFAHTAIDAGADLVFGHGPHVPRALEVYRERLVAYSLGNFCTYYGISVAGDKGLAPLLTVTIDAEGRFIDGQVISARQNRPRGPQPDDRHAAAKLIKSLTEADFPATRLTITADGQLAPLP